MDREEHKDEAAELDRRIAEALAIDVPELKMPNLPEIDDSNVVGLKRRRLTTPAWIALAASVVIAAFVGVRMFDDPIEYSSLAEEIVAHLDHEPYALRVTDKAVSNGRLAYVVPANIANMNHDAGLITYAQICIINGNRVPHLVIQGKKGPVTVLLMPEETVDQAIDIKGESIKGVILPVGSGSIAIIGEKGESLDTIQESVVHSVAWST